MSTPAILTRLNDVSSAEDFFHLLGVDYDPKVLSVLRLHVLRRMGQYLASEDFSSASDDEAIARCREFLAKAYDDFLASSPLQERVFKVLKDAVKPAPAPKLVQLAPLE